MRVVRERRGARRGARGFAARGEGRVRRRTALLVERFVERSRHVEVQVVGRQPRGGRAPRRARVLDPAPAPEGGRGDARARRSTRAVRGELCDAGVAAARAVDYRSAGNGRVPDGARRPLLLPRDEHAAAGGAPGDRGRDRARHRAPAARGGGRPRRCRCDRATSPRTATRSSAASTPRTRAATTCPRRAACSTLVEPAGPGIRVDSGLVDRQRGQRPLRPAAREDRGLGPRPRARRSRG